MRQITRKPRLVKIRNKLIFQLKKRGFFIDEIGEIFRLGKSRIAQIVDEEKIKRLTNAP